MAPETWRVGDSFVFGLTEKANEKASEFIVSYVRSFGCDLPHTFGGEAEAGLGASGDAGVGAEEHSRGAGEEVVGSGVPGQEADVVAAVIGGDLAGSAEDQDWLFGQAVGQFTDKCGTGEPWLAQRYHDQPQPLYECGILQQNERLGSVGNPLHVLETPLQHRLAGECQKGIVINQQNGGPKGPVCIRESQQYFLEMRCLRPRLRFLEQNYLLTQIGLVGNPRQAASP